jgi:hypothetical protein
MGEENNDGLGGYDDGEPDHQDWPDTRPLIAELKLESAEKRPEA